MQNTIDIGIPIDVEKLLYSRGLIQSSSGGGKSYLLRKIVESVGNTIQQIILDPEGEYVTLREKFDFALVSKDGDIPLSLKYAETLAHKLLETGTSAIIDLYELKKHERILFVQRFLEAMINAPKELYRSCFVYLDEADIFCPESTKGESTSSVIDLCARGRKRGFGAILATQRLSKLNKDAAAECHNKFIGRTSLDLDRKRAGDELCMTNKADTIKLRQMKPGEFYAFGPAISDEVIQFKVNKVITTHLQSGTKITVKPPTPDAIKKILSKLADIPQEAEKELANKQQMLSEITRLRTEVTKLSRPAAGILGSEEKKKLDARITQLENALKFANGQWDKYNKLAIEYSKRLDKIIDIAGQQAERKEQLGIRPIEELYKTPDEVVIKMLSTKNDVFKTKHIPDITKKLMARAPVKPANSSSISTNLPVGENKILIGCAQYPNGLSRQQLTVITGYKRSTRDAYIKRLKEKQLVILNGDKVQPTDQGLSQLGSNFEPLPTGEALQQHWLKSLPRGEAAILEILITQWPNAVRKDDITDTTGFKRSTRDAYIKRMVSKEIVDISVGNGALKASESLFD